MNFDKEMLGTISVYLSKIILFIAPGMIIIDFALHKGFFSGGINNLIDLLFLIIWSICFSLPYYYSAIIMIVKNQINTIAEFNKAKEDPSAYETVSIYIFALLLLNYLFFKTLFH